MDLKNEKPAYEDVIDLRKAKAPETKKPDLNVNTITVDTSDKELSYDEPTGDIGEEMQPLRGSGKAMQKKINQWKVR